LNALTASANNSLEALAGRLTEAQDREAYAALLSYLNSLPAGDELRRLAELMGLVSLLGQRVPSALADAMTEMRELTTAARDYHIKVDERLAHLPGEIAAGVNVAAIARDMAEAFRQQLATTGLENSAALLRASAGDINAVSAQLSAAIKPVSQEYETVAATISAELTKLTAASAELQHYNAQLIAEKPSNSWMWNSLLLVVMFLFGGLAGIVFETNQTTSILTNMNTQIERIQMPTVLPLGSPNKKYGRQR
jgi:hypothetical protein